LVVLASLLFSETSDMQTKFSYRALKWTLILGALAPLGACVVTQGDGDDVFGEGGESGSSTAAGTSSTAGTGGSTGGTGATAGTSGSTAAAGAGAGAGGEGGVAYVPGLCEADSPTPTMEPSCDPLPKDDMPGRECVKCMKANCCSAWQACFGEAPTTACGYGPTESADGQFVCVLNCFADGAATADAPGPLLEECTASCTNQCDAADNGLPLDATADLIECANAADCQEACLPF
jgi:hypothetical protein